MSRARTAGHPPHQSIRSCPGHLVPHGTPLAKAEPRAEKSQWEKADPCGSREGAGSRERSRQRVGPSEKEATGSREKGKVRTGNRSGQGNRWETKVLGGSGGEGEGGEEIKAHPKREFTWSGAGLLQPSDLRALRASPAIRPRLRRGPGRPEPSPGARPALPRRAYLGHGCLLLGPALGHRLMPRGTGHSRLGGIARSCWSPPPAPGLR